MKYLLELTDTAGTACHIRLSLPFLTKNMKPEDSAWRVLDEGCLKVRSGRCNSESHSGSAYGPSDIYLMQADSKWGLRIEQMFDTFDQVNSSGGGEVVQAWVISLEPGHVFWSLI